MRKNNIGNTAGSDCSQCKGYLDTLPKFLQYFSNRKTMENPTLDESHIELIHRANASRLEWRESCRQKKSNPDVMIRPISVKQIQLKSMSEEELKTEEKLRSIEEKLEQARVKCRNVEAKLECLRLECTNYISKVCSNVKL